MRTSRAYARKTAHVCAAATLYNTVKRGRDKANRCSGAGCRLIGVLWGPQAGARVVWNRLRTATLR